jgi:hypothetical protein
MNESKEKQPDLSPAEFTRMSLSEKMRWIHFGGEFIMDIRYYHHKVNLYKVCNFFVEIFYHHGKDSIEKADLLDRSSSRMKFYADQIRINPWRSS